MKTTCEAEVRMLPGGAVIVLSGEIDGHAADTLTAAYERAVADGDPATVVLDFAAVQYINSTGIALIVSVLARARSQRRSVVASGLSDHYREIFDITRLSDFIELFPSLDGAVSRLTEAAAAFVTFAASACARRPGSSAVSASARSRCRSYPSAVLTWSLSASISNARAREPPAGSESSSGIRSSVIRPNSPAVSR